MILTCPSCHTRFQVDDETALSRREGRLVRCGNCGHRWRHTIEVSASPPAGPEPPPSEERRPVLASMPEPRPRSRRALAAAALVVLALVLVGAALAVGIAERRAIVARYPAAAAVYARIGQPVEFGGPSVVRLKIVHVAASLTHNRLIIEGDVQNPGATTSKIPRLRITLKDRRDHEVQSQVIDAPEPQVAAGGHVHFSAPFENPNTSATDVEVTFASSAAKPDASPVKPSQEPSAASSGKPARS